MSTSATQPDLIISLSRDRVRLNLLENAESGRPSWQSSFEVDHIFLEEQISQSLDQVLLDNPMLIDHFPCVEIIVLDRPNICVSKKHMDGGKLGEIAARHLRLRTGDTLTTDIPEEDVVVCYTLPTETLVMLKEYYSNIGCSHLSSILWHALRKQNQRPEKDVTRIYFTLMNDLLVLLAEKNNKLIFSKNFSVRDQADLFYYSIACSRMLKADEHWLIRIANEEVKFEIPDDPVLKMDNHLQLPSMHILMSEYKICES